VSGESKSHETERDGVSMALRIVTDKLLLKIVADKRRTTKRVFFSLLSTCLVQFFSALYLICPYHKRKTLELVQMGMFRSVLRGTPGFPSEKNLYVADDSN
jgi:hypothetical protein